MTEPTVTIPVARLTELETTIADLQARLAKRTYNNLDRLNAYNKAHPEKVKERHKKWRTEHREEYNARRRELYRQKKATAASVVIEQPIGSPLSNTAVVEPEKAPGPK